MRGPWRKGLIVVGHISLGIRIALVRWRFNINLIEVIVVAFQS